MSAVSYELRDDRIAVLTMAVSERRNALSRPLLGELGEGLERAIAEDATAAVLTGAGPTFSAGADLDELSGTEADVAVDDAIAAVTGAIRSCPIPVVAAVEGACVGAAVDLALACDVRVLGEGGYFAVPAVALGILYSPAALERMAARVPQQTLARLLLLGELIGGEEAVRAGLAARVVATGAALEESLVLASGASGGASEAGAATKAALAELAAGSFDAADWERTRRELLSSPARAERVAAAQAGRRVRA